MKLNKKLITLLLTCPIGLIFVLSAFYSFEGRPLLVNDMNCLCNGSINDQYNLGLRFSQGKFKGQCINSCEKRPVVVLRSTNTGEERSGLEVANIFHEGEFWKSHLPTNNILKSKIIFEQFTNKFNHVAIEFVFDRHIDIHLISHNQPERILLLRRNSFVFSSEGIAANDQRYDMIDGFKGNYPMFYRLYSTEKFKELAAKKGHPVTSYNTKFDKLENQKLLLSSLEKSTTQSGSVYQLFFNNCATSTIDLLLKAKSNSKARIRFWNVMDPLRGVPLNIGFGTKRTLRWWKLVDLEADEESQVN